MKNLSSIAQDVSELLIKRGETVAISESSSGGLISAALLAVRGISIFLGEVLFTRLLRANNY